MNADALVLRALARMESAIESLEAENAALRERLAAAEAGDGAGTPGAP